MNDEKMNESEYTWNDFVRIKDDALEELYPGEIGVVCGMSKIKLEKIAKKHHTDVGDWVYTVEFHDGSDIHIAGRFLMKAPFEDI